MIPGDIDLTQDLDFRNVKRRETPQLPASWKGKDRINISNGNLSTYIGSSNFTYTTSTPYSFSWTYYDTYDDSNITTTIRTNGIREVHNHDQLSWNIITYYNDYLDTTISNWNEYNEITSSSYNNLSVKYFDDKPKYDIFGNKIKSPEQIPKIPWSKKLYNPSIPSLPWSKRRFSLRNEDYIPDIPWDIEDDWFAYRRKDDLSTPTKRANKLISWLSKKSYSFIERYFDRDNEDVDLSYLTNMNWIHINDAVIDSIYT